MTFPDFSESTPPITPALAPIFAEVARSPRARFLVRDLAATLQPEVRQPRAALVLGGGLSLPDWRNYVFVSTPLCLDSSAPCEVSDVVVTGYQYERVTGDQLPGRFGEQTLRAEFSCLSLSLVNSTHVNLAERPVSLTFPAMLEKIDAAPTAAEKLIWATIVRPAFVAVRREDDLRQRVPALRF